MSQVQAFFFGLVVYLIGYVVGRFDGWWKQRRGGR